MRVISARVRAGTPCGFTSSPSPVKGWTVSCENVPPPAPFDKCPGFSTKQPWTSRAKGWSFEGVMRTSGCRGNFHFPCCRRSTGASATVEDMLGGGKSG